MEKIVNNILVLLLLLRLFFGGYIAAMDQYLFNDFESTLTVFLIYGLLALFAAIFLLGNRRNGLIGIIMLDSVFIALQAIFVVATASQITDPGPHDPWSNWWATGLIFSLSSLTLAFAVSLYRGRSGAKTRK